MKIKRIYYYKNLRCTIKYVKYLDHYHCQLQVKWLFMFWNDVGCFITLKEGFWGEDRPGRINPMVNTYRFGDISECWITGTLDIKKRVSQMFKQYVQDVKIKSQHMNKLELL